MNKTNKELYEVAKGLLKELEENKIELDAIHISGERHLQDYKITFELSEKEEEKK